MNETLTLTLTRDGLTLSRQVAQSPPTDQAIEDALEELRFCMAGALRAREVVAQVSRSPHSRE